MQTILVTGSAGFIGKHLMEALGRRQNVCVIGYDIGNTPGELDQGTGRGGLHLSSGGSESSPEAEGVQNRQCRFYCVSLWPVAVSRSLAFGRDVVFHPGHAGQSVWGQQAPSGETMAQWAASTGGPAVVFRLKNVFGKWCRPNYNSVTATFCHNIAHDLPITISDPGKELELVYIDDVIAAFLEVLDGSEVRGQRSEASNTEYRDVPRSFIVTLGELAARIRSFGDSRTTSYLCPRSPTPLHDACMPRT